MQIVKCNLLLGGDRNHVLKKEVTVPELEVLRTLHGDDAVTDIEVVTNRDVNHAEERERLRRTFKKNIPAADASGRKNVVDVVFSNPRSPLPKELKDIGITNHKPAVKGKTSGGSKSGGSGGSKSESSGSADGNDELV